MKKISALFCILFLLGTLSCHNLTVPLENNNPALINYTQLTKMLYFPDTTVCTLQVSDLNDTIFSISSIIQDSVLTDTVAWPGNYIQPAGQYGTKDIVLSLPGCGMCCLNGSLLISDENGASVELPYTINKHFQDTFSQAYPDSSIWKTYRENDTAHIKSEYLPLHKNYILKFVFDTNSIFTNKSIGLRSNFGIVGDFSIMIDFGLIELSFERLNGVTVSFFVSTSSDTTQWSGIEAGLYLYGTESRLRVRAAKGFDGKSKDVNFYSGKMKISRKDSELSLFCWKGAGPGESDPIKSVSYSGGDTAYVHLQMKVDSLNETRFCEWDNFNVTMGNIVF